MRNGSTQGVKINSNVEGVRVYMDQQHLCSIKRDTLLEFARAVPLTLRFEKDGYMPQTVVMKQQYEPALGTGLLAFASMYTPFFFMQDAFEPEGQGKAALVGLGIGLGVYTIGSVIDLSSGSRWSFKTDEVKCTLYPAAQYQYSAKTKARCTKILSRPWYLGAQEKLPVEIKPENMKEAIDIYMVGMGLNVPGQGFDEDTASDFSVQLQVDSMEMYVHDETTLSRIIYNEVKVGDGAVGEGVIIPAETQTLYTEVRLKLNWKVANRKMEEAVYVKTDVRQVHYGTQAVKAWYATLQTSLVQLFNDKSVYELMNAEGK